MTHPGIEIIRQLLGDARTEPTTLLERRAGMAELAGSPPAPDGVAVEQVDLGGRPAEALVPDGAPDDRAVLYLHGGGYCSGSSHTHRALGGDLALATGATVYTLGYRLAPEDPFPAALDDAVAAFVALGQPAVAVAGDSAGGGLAVATALALGDRGHRRPAALALFSPWTDLSQSSVTMEANDGRDPSLTKEALDQMAEGYLAGHDARDPLASPRWADRAALAALPPLRIDVGSEEVLLGDSQRLAEAALDAGVEVTLTVWPEMIHVFAAFPPDLVPEAAECVEATGAFLARHLAAAIG